MRKIANQPHYWSKVEQDLRKITNLPGPVHALLGSDKLKWHQSLPPGVDPNAKAYVTTEDTNDDGDIETINLIVTNIEKEWPQDVLSKINQMDQSDPVYRDILDRIAKMLIHELAHIEDHKDGEFPGGEGVAESRENAFTSNFATASIINEDNKVITPLGSSKNGDFKVKKEIISLANHLDSLGHTDLADRLDAIMKSAEGLADFAIDPADQTLTEEEKAQNENVEEEEREGDDSDEAIENAEAWTRESLLATEPGLEDNIEAMAKIISREFSLTSHGNVNRG